MPEFIDDKSEHCIPFVIEQVQAHQKRHANDPNPPPFFLGLNGVQGAGKTVLVTSLRETLSAPPYNLPTISFSLDDIYLSHEDQALLTRHNAKNPLLKHRGQPATHDVPLGLRVFNSLRAGEPTKIPAYDKSAFNGEGDRAPEEQWETVNDVSMGQERIKVVIFEGWCVGFRALGDEDLYNAWSEALGMRRNYTYDGQLGYLDFDHVKIVNKALKAYDVFTDQLDAFIHIDAQNIHYVYDWRQEQEENLRATKGTGMTIEQVNKFVGGYYSSYELYTRVLRQGVFNPEARIHYGNGNDQKEDGDWRGKQLRLVVNQDRRVLEVVRI